MSRRRDRDRRRQRRERADAPKPDLLPEPVAHERNLSRFRHMHGWAVMLGFVAHGPRVEATTPEQLAETVGRVLVAARARQPS